MLQLRVKDQTTAEFVETARAVKRITDAAGAALIVNDRPDIARLIDAAGVHLGQEDLPPREARIVVGQDKVIGLSTHCLEQIEAATASMEVDYIGVGPIFATASKAKLDPLQGLEGVRAARRYSLLPIVAIGGITEYAMPDILTAGADAVAMISDLVRAPDIEAKVRRLIAG